MSEKNIFEFVWKYAIADSLDMMERYVEWFNWCDGWIADAVWTVGVSVEEKIQKNSSNCYERLPQSGIQSGLNGGTNP